MRTVVSQGCRPIGTPLTVTRAEGNILGALAGVDAMTKLQDLAAEVSEDDRLLMGMGLHLGIVVDEHQLDFEPGDFLVRAVTGADPSVGSLTVGDVVEVGQTVQFHVRDAAAADDDLRGMLAGVDPDEARVRCCSRATGAVSGSSVSRRTTPESSTCCSGRSRSRGCSARARWARSAGDPSSTSTPRASPSSGSARAHIHGRRAGDRTLGCCDEADTRDRISATM